jgi:hypothetical protein
MGSRFWCWSDWFGEVQVRVFRFESSGNWGVGPASDRVRPPSEAGHDGRHQNKKPIQTDLETVLINRSHTHPLPASRRGHPWYQRVSGCFVKDQAFSGPEQV